MGTTKYKIKRNCTVQAPCLTRLTELDLARSGVMRGCSFECHTAKRLHESSWQLSSSSEFQQETAENSSSSHRKMFLCIDKT